MYSISHEGQISCEVKYIIVSLSANQSSSLIEELTNENLKL